MSEGVQGRDLVRTQNPEGELVVTYQANRRGDSGGSGKRREEGSGVGHRGRSLQRDVVPQSCARLPRLAAREKGLGRYL